VFHGGTLPDRAKHRKREGSSSFLEKRTKKLLLIASDKRAKQANTGAALIFCLATLAAEHRIELPVRPKTS
jgi:hypothetical protein